MLVLTNSLFYDCLRKTFIRNAAGKALVDSPALNSTSRQVLVPIARNILPPVINIPGPGPPEPRQNTQPLPAAAAAAMSRAAATSISRSNSDLVASQALHDDFDDAGGGDGEEDGEEEADDEELSPAGVAQQTQADPYANLDGAFGNYVADQPRPQHTDDLLF